MVSGVSQKFFITNFTNRLHSFFGGSSIRNGSGTAPLPSLERGYTSMGVFANLILTLSRSACRAMQALPSSFRLPFYSSSVDFVVASSASYFEIKSSSNTELCYEEAA
jgi:hypothetical protein